MKLEEIETAVEVQRKAYQLLLWLKQRARTNPDLFRSEQIEPFATGATCEEWVRRCSDSFPTQWRPLAEEVRAFAYVLSSFFKTSFRIAEVRHWDEVETTLVAGLRGIRGRRHKQKLAQRQTQDAQDLRRLSLNLLSEECGQIVTAEDIEHAGADPEFSQQLTRYAYGVELVRRCHYASQGTVVHRLWLELDESVRKNLSASTIWKAREYLVA
ncbi:MAG: hypothetical protein AAB370_00165 [Verrucomicrobiota bacterium]|mgnify:CR=1 FL=1